MNQHIYSKWLGKDSHPRLLLSIDRLTNYITHNRCVKNVIKINKIKLKQKESSPSIRTYIENV